MKAGDLVRFRTWRDYKDNTWRIGLLVRYESWEKVGTVLYEGQLIKLKGEQIQKAGKKDESR